MNSLSLTGVSSLYVGVVLFINGLSLLNKIDRKEIVFIDFFCGRPYVPCCMSSYL